MMPDAIFVIRSRRLLRVAALVIGVSLALGTGACLTFSRPWTDPARPADMVIVNGRIWTGRDRSGAAPASPGEPTGVAVRGGRIVAVGDDASIRSYIAAGTEVIDAHGRRVIPGITDSHTHIVSGGFQLGRLTLRDVRGRDEFVRAVAAEARTKRKGQWVLGGRWSVESWDKPEPPHKSWLDPVTGNVAAFLSRMDGHQALVNSAALRLAGIDASGPPDPKGGQIERDPNTREPTGILKESAMGLVGRLIPDPTSADRFDALSRAMKHANSLGVTSVHDMCSRSDLDAFRRAEREGILTLRITAYLSVDDWAAYADRIPGYDLNSDWVRLAGFKGYVDGSLGSRTAYMREPYNDATPETPYPRGQLAAMADPPESFQQRVALADARGLQIAVHAIGDEGNHLLLNAYETTANPRLEPARISAALEQTRIPRSEPRASARADSPESNSLDGRKNPYTRTKNALKHNIRRDAHHRVEHAQHLHVSDITRFAELGVVASMQPFHKADDGRYAEKALGKKRLAGSYAFRQLVDAGALVIFGSDWPVVTLNPFKGIDSAVNAKTLDGKVWLPSHSLTVEEALRAYTVLPPRAIHRDDRFGTIEVGKYADMVILSDDPLSIPKERLGEIRVHRTIVGGKIVFSRDLR